MSVTSITAKHHALTMQLNSIDALLQFGEHDVHLNSCSDRRNCIGLDVDSEGVDVAGNAPAASGFAILGRPHKEDRSPQLVAN